MEILKRAQDIKNETVNDYRRLHEIAEIGFELENTVAYVKKRLDEIEVKYNEIGRNGIVAVIGGGENCIMLRADMDALPIKEETELEYAAKNGNMHACGHDAHTAMLLSCARLIKENESELKGSVKLLFQPAEELLEGAKNMIEGGVLESPTVNAAAMLHVVTGTEMESGSVIVSSEGVIAPAVEYFRVKLNGKGAHGSMPEKSRDPLALACRIALALDEIKAKELGLGEKSVITVGHIDAGNSANVIPDTALIEGSARAFRTDTMEYVKKRIKEISLAYGQAYGVIAEVDFYSGAPALENDKLMSEFAVKCAENVLGKVRTYTSAQLTELAEKNGQKSIGAGSEDFAYIAKRIPSVMIALCAGKASKGYTYPLHHPKFQIDEKSLPYGAAMLTKIALEWQNK